MSFSGAVKEELCRAGLNRRCCAQAEAYGVLLYCNTFTGEEARIVTGHGQMGEQELSAVMQAMVDGEADVLVCTTIIETGIDIPNVNTLIIEDADRMGLAQLHQIRGRIGRSARRAYAYMTFRRGKILQEVAAELPEQLQTRDESRTAQLEMRSVAQEMHHYEELSASERTLQLLEHERMKYSFFAAMSQEIQFEYTVDPPIVTLNTWGADKLGLKETVMDPLHNDNVRGIMSEESVEGLVAALHNTTPAQPVIKYQCKTVIDGEARWCRIIARATWSADEPPVYTGAIGKAVDIHDSQMKLAALERLASHDTLTGLLNHASAKKQIVERIEDRPGSQFAMVIFDLDHFKNANNTYGHIFGDNVLKFLADRLQESIRGADIAARVGGDEFLLFLEYGGELDPIVSRIYSSISGSMFEDFPICLSMGIAPTDVVGTDYDALFHAADQALYKVKRSGRGRYAFYDESMRDMLSVISPIEGSPDAGEEAGGEKGESEP